MTGCTNGWGFLQKRKCYRILEIPRLKTPMMQLRPEKKSGVSVTAGVKSGKTSLGASGGDTKARWRKSSTGTSPRKRSNA